MSRLCCKSTHSSRAPLRTERGQAAVCLVPSPGGLVASFPRGLLLRSLCAVCSPNAQIWRPCRGVGRTLDLRPGGLLLCVSGRRRWPWSCLKGRGVVTGQRGGGEWHSRLGNIVFCFEEFGFLIDVSIDFKQPFLFLSKDWCVCVGWRSSVGSKLQS